MGYNANMLPEISLGDRVKLRKPHPCGGYMWKIVRLGADIGWCAKRAVTGCCSAGASSRTE